MREPTVAQRRAVEINPNNQWNQADMAIVLMAGEVAAPRRAVRMKPADTTGLTWVEEVLGYWFGELGEAHWFDEN
jgi:hypothetical protein